MLDPDDIPNKVSVEYADWVKILFCIRHLMKSHPEYNKMMMTFYARLWEICPIDQDSQEHFDSVGFKPDGEPEEHYNLDEMIWDLGMVLPSWEGWEGPDDPIT